MNLYLPQAKADATLPATADRASVVDFPRYPEPPLDQSESEANLGQRVLHYFTLARKHKYLIIAVIAIFVFGGVIVTMLMPKIYTASTTIKIDRAVPQVFKSRSEQAGPDDDAGFYLTQYELIRSRVLAERVATALDLGQSAFLAAPQPSLLERLVGPKSNVGPVLDANAVKAREAIAVDQVMGGLSVQPVGQSSIVRIRYSDRSPIWAQRISIAVAEEFEKMTLDMRFALSNHARSFLQEQLDEQKLKLEESEKQLVEYAQKEGIVDVDNKQPQVSSELQTVQNAYSSAVTKRMQLEESWHQSQTDDRNSLPQVMSDGLIQSARTKLAELRATIKTNSQRLSLRSRRWLLCKIRLAILETIFARRSRASRAQSTTNTRPRSQTKSLSATSLVSLRQKRSICDVAASNYTILMREVDTNRSLYDGVLQQYRELGVASDAESNNVSIVDQAELPGAPSSPSLKINLIVALALGAAAAAAAVWLIEVLDDTFKTPEDLEELLGIPVLGIVPLYRDKTRKNRRCPKFWMIQARRSRRRTDRCELRSSFRPRRAPRGRF